MSREEKRADLAVIRLPSGAFHCSRTSPLSWSACGLQPGRVERPQQLAPPSVTRQSVAPIIRHCYYSNSPGAGAVVPAVVGVAVVVVGSG